MPDPTDPGPRSYRRSDPRCGGCGAEAVALRRGRCSSCYARWVRLRPVGVGATCASCGDRRLVHLRHFELHALWVVLCHNCCARADGVSPLPRSLDGLIHVLKRNRRSSIDRRTGTGSWYDNLDRRGPDRRFTDRDEVDAGDLVIVELEADYEEADGDEDHDDFGPITQVHPKI